MKLFVKIVNNFYNCDSSTVECLNSAISSNIAYLFLPKINHMILGKTGKINWMIVLVVIHVNFLSTKIIWRNVCHYYNIIIE